MHDPDDHAAQNSENVTLQSFLKTNIFQDKCCFSSVWFVKKIQLQNVKKRY